TRAVGYNPSASKYGGISVKKNLVVIMLISGGIGGLAGALIVMGPLYGFYLYGSTAGLGFDGIAVALIGGNHPIGVIFGALLFGWLQISSTKLQQNAIPKDIANTMKGFIVLIIAVPLFSKMVMKNVNRSSWYNQSINKFKAEKEQKKPLGGTIYAIIMFPISLLIFGTIVFFNHLEKQIRRIFSIIIRKKIEISVLLGSMVILVTYLEISGIISFGELELAELLFRIPGIGLLLSLLSNISTELYLTNKNLYLSLISGVITILFCFLLLLSRKHEFYSKFSQIFLIFLIPSGTLLFFNLILLMGQDLILLTLVSVVLIFILYQEYSSHRITIGKDLTDSIESEVTGINFVIYGVYLIFAILAVFLENFDLPFSLPLVFFNINNLGSLFVILGIILIPMILHFWNNKKYKHVNGVNRYVITIGGFGTLTCVIVMLEKIPLSSPIDLFFFTLFCLL
ncbi:MAG: ABC transporter permease subunit, partial [Candidatus Hodarchaeales archaeon]